MTLAGSYHFLTTKPLTRILFEEQQEFLYILALKAQRIAINVNIYYSDGTTHDYRANAFSTQKGQLRVKNIGFESMNYQRHHPEKKIEKVTIRVDDEGEQVAFFPRVLPSDEAREFHYFNSLGGMDSLVCTGDEQVHMETDYETAFHASAGELAVEEGQYRVYPLGARLPFEVFSGFKPAKEIAATRDMFLNNRCYELVKKDTEKWLVPVTLNQKKVSYPALSRNEKAIKFKVRPAYDERALDRVV